MKKKKNALQLICVMLIYIFPIVAAIGFCFLNWGRWQGYNWLMCIVSGVIGVSISILTRMFLIGFEDGIAK